MLASITGSIIHIYLRNVIRIPLPNDIPAYHQRYVNWRYSTLDDIHIQTEWHMKIVEGMTRIYVSKRFLWLRITWQIFFTLMKKCDEICLNLAFSFIIRYTRMHMCARILSSLYTTLRLCKRSAEIHWQLLVQILFILLNITNLSYSLKNV